MEGFFWARHPAPAKLTFALARSPAGVTCSTIVASNAAAVCGLARFVIVHWLSLLRLGAHQL